MRQNAHITLTIACLIFVVDVFSGTNRANAVVPKFSVENGAVRARRIDGHR